MKKEVTVCDSDRCRSLADRVCPLCEKDFCSGHFRPELYVHFAVRRPGAPQPGQAPFAPGQEKYDANNTEELRIGICDGCYQDLDRAQRGSAPKFDRVRVLERLTEEQKTPMIETCRSALAAYKLAQSEK